MGTQRIPSTIIILRNPDKILFTFLLGFLSSLTPQYIVKGNEIIPVQVIRVPKGIDLSLSKAVVSKEEPITRSTTTLKVKIIEM